MGVPRAGLCAASWADPGLLDAGWYVRVRSRPTSSTYVLVRRASPVIITYGCPARVSSDPGAINHRCSPSASASASASVSPASVRPPTARANRVPKRAPARVREPATRRRRDETRARSGRRRQAPRLVGHASPGLTRRVRFLRRDSEAKRNAAPLPPGCCAKRRRSRW